MGCVLFFLVAHLKNIQNHSFMGNIQEDHTLMSLQLQTFEAMFWSHVFIHEEEGIFPGSLEWSTIPGLFSTTPLASWFFVDVVSDLWDVDLKWFEDLKIFYSR